MRKPAVLAGRVSLTLALFCAAAGASTLRFCLRSEPRTLDPLLVEDDASETIRYLTAGFLVRLNRVTQKLEPSLATKWAVSENGRRIDFVLRPGVRFSDGSVFTAADVDFTIRKMMDPATHSPIADSFRSGTGNVESDVKGPDRISIRFPHPVAALAALFDGVPIVSHRAPTDPHAVLGPFKIASHQPGVSITLERNQNYWETDTSGHQLPYLESIHIDIQQNRSLELLRLKRGEIDLIQSLDAESFDNLRDAKPAGLRLQDAGPSLDAELMWFNLAPGSPIPSYRKAWFSDSRFRRAVSAAIHRDDICRMVYRGHAVPAVGPVSPSNLFWFNKSLPKRSAASSAAIAELKEAGFRFANGELHDREGRRVEFSLVSNAGNKAHERMLSMLQQDLAEIGIRLNTSLLDFASLIERITRSYNYEACLMSLTNIELDPNEQMNVWLSSAPNHQWNPNQKTPATAWEARIDQLMQEQAAAADPARRKKLFDEVQQIVRTEEPFLYLVHPNALSAVSAEVRNVAPAMLRPQIYWNAERLSTRDDHRTVARLH